MGNLILIRHGESEYNRDEKFTGLHNPGLTDLGKSQALLQAAKLKNTKIYKAYVSELLRAQQTLTIILDNFGQPVEQITDALLNERDYGDFTGMFKQDVISDIGHERYLKFKHHYTERIPNGESIEDVCERVENFLAKYSDELKMDKTFLIVAHNNLLRCMVKVINRLSDQDFIKISIPNGKPILIKDYKHS